MSLRVISVTLSTAYQAVGDLVDAFAGKPLGPTRVLRNGTIKNTGAVNVTISISPIAVPAGNNDLSKILAAGEELPFTEINMAALFAKAASGTPVLEIYGDA